MSCLGDLNCMKPFPLQGVTFKLSNAGHILGSCFILFTFPGDGTPDFRVIFSGDLGCTDTPIIPDPDPPDACDLLVLESTYGDRNHTGREDRVTALKKLLKRALEDKGIVYIPAFSLGRTQELIYELDRIKILNIKGPAIIIAGSGMCTGGRIVDHLKNGLDNPANDVFFVGYQAKGTPGRAIMEGKTPSRAGIHTLTGYSAHADQNSLVAWVKSMPEPPGDIRLVHGDPEAQKALALKLRHVIN